MGALRVLLTTIGIAVLMTYAVSAAAIEWILRGTTRPAPPTAGPTWVHRGLACISVSPSRPAWPMRFLLDSPAAQVVAGQQRMAVHTPTMTRLEIRLALALWLTRRFDDDQLTRLQGDGAWFGRGAFGLEQGSWVWFGRPLEQLSTAQAALLVGLEQQPHQLDPAKDEDKALRRRQFVLRAWEGCALIPEGTAAALEDTPVLEGVLRLLGE